MRPDNTHNAARAAAIAGLASLKALPANRRIAVLGDMLNLGPLEEEAHRVVGREAARSTDYLITRGERAAFIADSARQAGLTPEQVVITSTHEDAAQAVHRIIERSGRNNH